MAFNVRMYACVRACVSSHVTSSLHGMYFNFLDGIGKEVCMDDLTSRATARGFWGIGQQLLISTKKLRKEM